MAAGLSGKVALVTGAGSGIGRASALAFAKAGANLVLADLATAGGEETARHVTGLGARALFVRADVARASEVEALMRAAVQTYGRLDCAHNNAGIEGAMARTAECPEENWDRVLTTNLKGVWLCLKYEIAQMVTQGGGAIVNTASAAGLVGLAGFPAYTASKHGIVGLTRAAAVEYAKAGIRINAVCPGLIQTPMLQRQSAADPQRLAQWAALAPAGRLGTPEEVAEAVVWLCSEAASFVTGHALVVDGGLIAQ